MTLKTAWEILKNRVKTRYLDKEKCDAIGFERPTEMAVLDASLDVGYAAEGRVLLEDLPFNALRPEELFGEVILETKMIKNPLIIPGSCLVTGWVKEFVYGGAPRWHAIPVCEVHRKRGMHSRCTASRLKPFLVKCRGFVFYLITLNPLSGLVVICCKWTSSSLLLAEKKRFDGYSNVGFWWAWFKWVTKILNLISLRNHTTKVHLLEPCPNTKPSFY